MPKIRTGKVFGNGKSSNKGGTASDGEFGAVPISSKRTVATLPLLDRDKMKILVKILTAAVASTPEATAWFLSSKVGSKAPSPSATPASMTGSVTDTTATDFQDSSKQIADSAGLSESGESGQWLKKAWREDQRAGLSPCGRVQWLWKDPIVIDGTFNTNHDMNKPVEHCQVPSLAKLAPLPAFRYLLEESIQQYENTTISSRTSEVGDSQDVPPQCISG